MNKAKEYIEDNLQNFGVWDIGHTAIEEEDAYKAISIAEQETKDKAISILEDFIAEGLLITLKDNVINSFKELLNK